LQEPFPDGNQPILIRIPLSARGFDELPRKQPAGPALVERVFTHRGRHHHGLSRIGGEETQQVLVDQILIGRGPLAGYRVIHVKQKERLARADAGVESGLQIVNRNGRFRHLSKLSVMGGQIDLGWIEWVVQSVAGDEDDEQIVRAGARGKAAQGATQLRMSGAGVGQQEDVFLFEPGLPGERRGEIARIESRGGQAGQNRFRRVLGNADWLGLEFVRKNT
jgi:hypothetical protein